VTATFLGQQTGRQVTEGDEGATGGRGSSGGGGGGGGQDDDRRPILLASAPPKPSDIDDRFGRFDVKDMILGDETHSLVSDSWSTDVLGSDSELLNDAAERDRQSDRFLLFNFFRHQQPSISTVESGYIIHGYIIQPLILAIFGRNRIFT